MHGRRKSEDREKYDIFNISCSGPVNTRLPPSLQVLQLQVVTQLKPLQSGFLQTVDLQKSDHHT